MLACMRACVGGWKYGEDEITGGQRTYVRVTRLTHTNESFEIFTFFLSFFFFSFVQNCSSITSRLKWKRTNKARTRRGHKFFPCGVLAQIKSPQEAGRRDARWWCLEGGGGGKYSALIYAAGYFASAAAAVVQFFSSSASSLAS